MLFTVLAGLITCSTKRHRYFVKPFNNSNKFLKMEPGLVLRVVNGVDAVTSPHESLVVDVEDGINNLYKLKMMGKYLCIQKDEDKLTASPIFRQERCLWSISNKEKSETVGSALKLHGYYLTETELFDNRESTRGTKLRMVPIYNPEVALWKFEKFKPAFPEMSDSDTSSSSSDVKVKKEIKDPKRKEIVVGVSASLSNDEKKKYNIK